MTTYHIADSQTGLWFTYDVNGEELWDNFAAGPCPYFDKLDAMQSAARICQEHKWRISRLHVCDGDCVDDCPRCGPARSYG